MTYRVFGLIIGKQDFREGDRLFDIYTIEQGRISAIAQGCRKISSKLSGSLELLNLAVFTIAKGKILDRIATVDVAANFTNIKNDLTKLTFALYAIEIFNQLVKKEEKDEKLFYILTEYLHYIEIEDEQKNLIFLTKMYILKFFICLGYHPSSKELKNIFIKIEQKPYDELYSIKIDVKLNRCITWLLHQNLDKELKSQVYYNFLTNTKSVSA